MGHDKNNEKPADAENGRVIPFPQRNALEHDRDSSRGTRDRPGSFAWLERGPHRPASRPEPDDYHHRMLVNAGGFAVCTLLVVAGVWMASTMADLRRQQDCVLTGRPNCGPIAVPLAH